MQQELTLADIHVYKQLMEERLKEIFAEFCTMTGFEGSVEVKGYWYYSGDDVLSLNINTFPDIKLSEEHYGD